MMAWSLRLCAVLRSLDDDLTRHGVRDRSDWPSRRVGQIIRSDVSTSNPPKLRDT